MRGFYNIAQQWKHDEIVNFIGFLKINLVTTAYYNNITQIIYEKTDMI